MAAFIRSRPALNRVLFAVFQTRKPCIIPRITQTCRYLNDLAPVTSFRHGSGGNSVDRILSKAQSRNVDQNPATKSNTVDQALQALDREVRRVGRIRKDLFMDAYTKAIAQRTLAGHQSLVMLRCLGALMVEESPNDRTNTLNDLWQKMKEYGSPRDIMHYNALMKSYIQNDHKFSPTDILAEIQAANLSPNRVTFQRLIDRYCQDGDIEGAKQILGFMKKEGVPINELVFNALIMGHMRAGDEESAKGIFKIMRDAGVKPTNDTYSTLMQEYAIQGNMDAFQQTVTDAKDHSISFHPSHYSDVVVKMCQAGHGQYTTELMKGCPRTLGYNQDLMSGVLQLVARGQIDGAVALFEQMNHPTIDGDEGDVPHARFLVKALIKHGMLLPELTKIMNDLSEKKLISDGSEFITRWALVYKQPELAYSALQLLSEEGKPIRTHYFWPLFAAMKTAKNKEGLYRALEMSEKLVDESSEFLFTLHEYVIPALLEMGESEDVLVKRLKDIGVLEGDTLFALMVILIKHGRLDEAALMVMNEGGMRINQSVLVPHIRAVVANSNQPLDSVLKILSQSLRASSFVGTNFHPAELCGNTLYDAVHKRYLNDDQTIELVQKFIDNGLGIAPKQSDKIQTTLTAKHVPAELIEKILSIEIGEMVQSSSSRRDAAVNGPERMSDRSVEELEARLKVEPKSKMIKKWLLFKCCMDGLVERADELKNDLDSEGFIYRPDMLRNLWHLSVYHKKDLDEALKYKEKLESEYSDYGLYAACILHTATLHAEKGDIQASIDILTDYRTRHGEFMDERKYAEEYRLENCAIRLLKAVQDGGHLEQSRAVMEKVFELGYVKRGTYSLLKEYVNGYIEKGDVPAVVEAMQFITENYDRSPEFHQVFTLLIEKEDSENLQKVMDMVSASFGEMQALHHLVSALIQCGQVEKARKVMETPGIRALNDVLDTSCNLFIQQKKITELEALVDVTKGMYGLDRETMLFYLVKGYTRMEDVDKAMNAFTTFEEENINPRPRTLRYLANVLKSKGRDVPFDVPEIVNDDVAIKYSPQEQRALEKAASGVVPGMSILKQSCGGWRPGFLQNLTKVVYSSRRPGSLKFLVFELASMGDVEALENLREMNMNVLNIGLVHSGIFRAYMESNRPDQCISLMENDKENLKKYLNTKTICLFRDTYPDYYSKFEDLCFKSCDEGDMVIAGFLWNGAVMKNDFDKADSLIKRFPHLIDSLRIATVCIDAKVNNDEPKMRYIVNACKDNLVSCAFSYSYLIGLHTNNNNSQAALSAVEAAQDNGIPLTQLRPQALSVLEDLLVKSDKEVPWTRGEFSKPFPQQRQTQPSSSSDSSSSDSESDNEVSEQRT